VICVDASRNCRDSAPRIPFIFIALGSFPVGATGFLLSLKFMSNIDVILYSCRSDERILRRIFPRKEIGSYFLPFGIDTEVFQPRPADQRRAVKASLGIPDNSPLLVYAGRLNPHKNVADVINIYAAVALAAATLLFVVMLKMGNGVVIPNILQSTRGIFIVLISAVLSHRGSTILETQSRKVYMLRLAASILILVSIWIALSHFPAAP